MKVENDHVMSDEYDVLYAYDEFLEKFVISCIVIRIVFQCLKRLKVSEVIECEDD